MDINLQEITHTIQKMIYPNELLLLFVGGSRQFGYDIETSDYDLFGIFKGNGLARNHDMYSLGKFALGHGVEGALWNLDYLMSGIKDSFYIYVLIDLINFKPFYMSELGQKMYDNAKLIFDSDFALSCLETRINALKEKEQSYTKRQALMTSLLYSARNLLTDKKIDFSQEAREIRLGRFGNDIESWKKFEEKLEKKVKKLYSKTTIKPDLEKFRKIMTGE